jgi:hypothetical protein
VRKSSIASLVDGLINFLIRIIALMAYVRVSVFINLSKKWKMDLGPEHCLKCLLNETAPSTSL